MADNQSQGLRAWLGLTKDHQQQLAERSKDPDAFILHAQKIGISPETSKVLLETVGDAASAGIISLESSPNQPPVTPSVPPTGGSIFPRKSRNNKQTHHDEEAEEEERQEKIDSIDLDKLEASQDTASVLATEKATKAGKDAPLVKTFGETNAAYQEFMKHPEHGLDARIQKTDFSGLTLAQMEEHKKEIKRGLQREFLDAHYDTLDKISIANEEWKFTHLNEDEIKKREIEGHIKESERKEAQERHYIQKNFSTAQYRGTDPKFYPNGKPTSLSQDPNYLAYLTSSNSPVSKLNKSYTDHAQMVKAMMTNEYTKLHQEAQKNAQVEFYRNNVGYINRNYTPVVPEHAKFTKDEDEDDDNDDKRNEGDKIKQAKRLEKWKNRAQNWKNRMQNRPKINRRTLPKEAPEFPWQSSETATPHSFSQMQNNFQGRINGRISNVVRKTNNGLGKMARNVLGSRDRPGISREGGKIAGNIAKNIAKGLVKQGAGLAAKAGAGAVVGSGAWLIILIIILILLLVVLLILIFSQQASKLDSNTNLPVGYMRVKCSDPPGTDIIGDINKKFSINLTFNDQLTLDSAATYASVATTVQPKVYDDICRLFGHVNGKTTNNTFGKIFTGQGAYTPTSTRTVINLAFLSGDKTKDAVTNKFPDCSIQDAVPVTMRTSQPAVMIWNFYKPDKCTDFQLEFTLAKALADTLSKRAVASKDPVYNDYVNTIFPKNEYTPDPINNMYTNADIPTLFPNCSTDHNSSGCFDNMVAWYVTWGYPSNVCTATAGNSRDIIWLNSASAGEFGNHMDWISGQCSQASLAEVLNVYGMKKVLSPGKGDYYTIVDVAAQSQQLGVWDNYFHSNHAFGINSLQDAWQAEADHFSMNLDYQQLAPTAANLDAVINTANQGTPVIVEAPNHYLVVWGGDSQHVYTLDSSIHNYTWAPASTTDSVTINRQPYHQYEPTRTEFLHGLAGEANYWDGVRIILTPKTTSAGTGATTQTTSATASNACMTNSIALDKVGAFSVHTVSDIDQAAALGVKYIIPYYWGTFGNIHGAPFNPTDPTNPFGKELAKFNMKVIVDVTNYQALYSCQGGNAVPDLTFLTNTVNKVKDSALTMGYWIKDDDNNCNMVTAVKTVYSTIKKLDPNPNHYVVAGYGGAYSTKAQYADGEADVVAFYPYRAYNYLDTICNKAGTANQIMDCEVQHMSQDLKDKTPTGKAPPPWIGIYQAFYSPNRGITFEQPADVLYDVQDYIKSGAASVMPFGWEATDVTQLANNDAGIRSEICQVTKLMGGTCTQ